MTIFAHKAGKLRTQSSWRTITVLAVGIVMIAFLPAFAGAGNADTAANPTLKKRVLRIPLPNLGDISVVSTTVTVKRKKRSAGKSAKSKTPRVGIRVRNRKLLPANVIVVSASRKLKKPKGKLVVSKTEVVFLVINRKTVGTAPAAADGVPDPEIVLDPLTNRTLAVIARPQYWTNLIGSPAPPSPPTCDRWGDYSSASLTPGTDSTALFSGFPASRLWRNVCGELTDTAYSGQDPFRSFIGATVTPPPVLPPPLAGALRVCDHVGFPDELRILASANQPMSAFEVTVTSSETILSVFPNTPAGSTGTILAPQRASFSGVLPQNTESDFWIKLSANPTAATTVKVGYSISPAAPAILNFTSAFATCP